MPTNRYQDLIVWQKAIAFVKTVYEISGNFPREEMFGLTSQMRRSAVSIPSNIAEGQGRTTRGEFRQFLGHARGSLCELQTQVVIASELGYISATRRDLLLENAYELGRILNGLLSSIVRQRKSPRELTTNN